MVITRLTQHKVHPQPTETLTSLLETSPFTSQPYDATAQGLKYRKPRGRVYKSTGLPAVLNLEAGERVAGLVESFFG